MTQTATQVRVGANGKFVVAPVGTAAPVNPTSAWGAGWIDLGYSTKDGATLRDSRTMEEITVWQQMEAVRRIVTGKAFRIATNLRQWNKDTITFGFGGGTITSPAAGVFKYVPPAPEYIDERAAGLDWLDGIYHYRLIIPRGTVSEGVETKLAPTSNAELPIAFDALGSAGVDTWYFYTDDPAFDPAA
jgi:hypothetical protein